MDAAMIRFARRLITAFTALATIVGLSAIAVAQTAPDAIPAVGSTDLPRDLSPWGMFLNADPLVKGVLLGLAFASVVTWTVWLAKTIELMAASARARHACARLASARHLAEAAQGL